MRRRHVCDTYSWIDALRLEAAEPRRKLARMLLDHLEGILNYCRTNVPME